MIRRNRRSRWSQSARPQPNLALRRRLLIGTLLGAFAVLTLTVFFRQVVETEFLRAEGERRYLRLAEIPARRGMITDRNDEPLAVSTPVETVTADPRRLVQHLDQVPALALALGLDPDALREKVLTNRTRGFIYLKRRVEFDEARAVRALVAEHRITGIDLDSEYRRFYPGVEVFGHVIGFTDVDDRGQEGLELAYDDWLRAQPGLRRVIRDGRQRVVQEVEQVRPPQPGNTLKLTLDRRLQFLAYRELKAAVAEHGAVGGTLVALDVATGDILAMVNQPGYNPNSARDGSGEVRRNRALTDVMEPGSTVKPLVVAAALERRLVAPTTVFRIGGTMTVGRNTVRDVRNYGDLDVTGIITKSSNIGVVKIAQMMPYEALWDLYRQVGFGEITPIRFPGETSGTLRHHSQWRLFEHATLAFGYGLSVNALQLAQSYAVLAADGVKRPPRLVHAEGFAATVPETRVLSVETARAVRDMMETVVSEKGTARRAAISGYRVGGKTGTAKKAGPGGYSGRRYQAVFAGFAPAAQPRLVIVVMIDEPRGQHYYGGLVAAPVFQRVMEGALRLFNVPPDSVQPALLLARRETAP